MRIPLSAPVFAAVVAALACGGSPSNPPAATPNSGQAVSATAAVPSARFSTPAGYEVRVGERGVFLRRDKSVIAVIELDAGRQPRVDQMEGCSGAASGFASGLITAVMGMEKGDLRMVPVQTIATTGLGCRVRLAINPGQPPAIDTMMRRFGEATVFVMCSIDTDAQALACARVRDSLATEDSSPAPARTATIPSARFAPPAGYELIARDRSVILRQGDLTIVVSELKATREELAGMKFCLDAADSAAEGFIEGVEAKQVGEVDLVQVTDSGAAITGIGCRASFAAAPELPATVSVELRVVAGNPVAVLCSGSEVSQAIACASVRDSLAPR